MRQKEINKTNEYSELTRDICTKTTNLEVDLLASLWILRVDLVRDCRDVFSRVGLSRDVEVVLPEIGEEGEELLEGLVQVGGHVSLVLGEAAALREAKT